MKKTQKLALNIYKHYINEISEILKSLGININTVPVLDRLYKFHKQFFKNIEFIHPK